MSGPAPSRADAGTRWAPDQYLRFADHRLRPALELLARVPVEAARSVWDLGCGTGEVTRLLAGRWPGAGVTGLDHSPEMLERARAGDGRVRWVEADVATWSPADPADVLYSNATLHWLGDHATLFPRLLGFLGPGGCLAVQMPLSWEAPSHRLMRQTLADGGPGGGPLGPVGLRDALERRPVHDAAWYHDLLAARAQHVDVWETEYLQRLEGEDAVLEWVRGTGLRPVLHGLDDAARARFLELYRARLRAAYPPRPDGRTLYPFRRLFLVART